MRKINNKVHVNIMIDYDVLQRIKLKDINLSGTINDLLKSFLEVKEGNFDLLTIEKELLDEERRLNELKEKQKENQTLINNQLNELKEKQKENQTLIAEELLVSETKLNELKLKKKEIENQKIREKDDWFHRLQRGEVIELTSEYSPKKDATIK